MGRKTRKHGVTRGKQSNNKPEREYITLAESEAQANPPKPVKIIVIPAGVHAAKIAHDYADKVAQYYHPAVDTSMVVSVFEYYDLENPDIESYLELKIAELVNREDFDRVEIHAQGGLGCYVACRILQSVPERIEKVFFIGGAPADSFTSRAKFFHEKGINFWYWLHKRGIFRLKANYPNPYSNPFITELSDRATEIIHQHAELYRNQVRLAGKWSLDPLWHTDSDKVHYIDSEFNQVGLKHGRMYDYANVASHWYKHGVCTLYLPEQNFCADTLLPSTELFRLMEKCR